MQQVTIWADVNLLLLKSSTVFPWCRLPLVTTWFHSVQRLPELQMTKITSRELSHSKYFTPQITTLRWRSKFYDGIGGSCLDDDRDPVRICWDPPYLREEAAGCPGGKLGMPPKDRGLDEEWLPPLASKGLLDWWDKAESLEGRLFLTPQQPSHSYIKRIRSKSRTSSNFRPSTSLAKHVTTKPKWKNELVSTNNWSQ